MYIDCHCHLDNKTFGSVEELIKKCDAAGVRKIVTVGFDLPSSRLAKDFAERFDSVYFTAGYHPTELKKYREGDLDKIEELCAHKKCIALGEIGLDYHYPDTDKPLQKEIFIRQLHLADKIGLPVQIHSRDCAEDMLEILSTNSRLLKNGALMHCYSHSTELAEQFAKLGLYFSFGGASTWSGSKKAKRTIAMLPSDRLLTETDSPYMPPASLYGTFPNTPLSIPEICRNIADIKGIEASEMQSIIEKNFNTLFKKTDKS